MRVLVVDDEPDICEMLSTYLKSQGVDTTTAMNGEQAIRYFKSAAYSDKPYAVIVLDLALPVQNGFEVLKEIRQHEKEHRLKPSRIITFSAHTADVADTDLLETSGIDLHVEKPDEKQELIPAIMKALEIVEGK